MELVKIKEEPIDYDDVPVKVEPSDDSESSYGCIIFDNNLEIKEEQEEVSSDERDDYSSPFSSSLQSPESTCRVEILEQPLKKVRFRYLSELQGTPHGPLLGERSSKNNKTFPKVQLVGYEEREPVKIRCWLVDKTEVRGEVRPHCHDLVVRKCIPQSEIVPEPHEVCISRENNFTAVFENMVVLHCVQKDSESKYFDKDVKWNNRNSPVPARNSKFDKKKIRDKIKSINKNEVYLFFEAYIEYRNSVIILASALSNAIKNLKNPVSGDLKICRALSSYGPADGDTEVGLFTEKVPPDVKVKFFCNDRQWETIVSPEYMHRHVALTFRTPRFPYEIDDNVKVKYCLYRESDRGESNIMDFTYQPSELIHHGIGIKRRRLIQSSPSSYDDTDSNSSHGLPVVEMPKELNDILGSNCIFFTQEDSNDLVNSLLPAEISMEGCDSSDLNRLLNDNIDENNLNNFSGNSLVAALISDDSDPLIGAFSKRRNLMEVECDGRMEYYDAASGKFKKPEKPPQADSQIMRILKNILLTKVYKNHINVLQKAVELKRVDVLINLLTQINEFVKLPNDRILQKQRCMLPKIIVKIKDDNHKTLLHTAVMLERNDMIQALIDFGYSPLDKDQHGNNAFHLSVLRSSCSTLQALVSACVEINSSKQSTVRLSLQREGLLKTKLQPDVLSLSNFEGQNILHLAVRTSSIQMVNYIVGLKLIDLKSQVTNSGDSALHIACRLQKPEVAKILIREGADISQLNLQGYSPLHISVSGNDHLMAKLLIEEKGDPTQECVSLTLDQFNKEASDEKDSSSKDDDEPLHSLFQSNDAFALANDLMMVDILSGKMNSFTFSEDLTKPSSLKKSSDEGVLLTPEQVDKLSVVLAENNSWKLVVKRLNKPYLERLQSGFKQPERILLDYINRKKKDILGEEDQLNHLAEIFSSLDLHKAKEILVSNGE